MSNKLNNSWTDEGPSDCEGGSPGVDVNEKAGLDVSLIVKRFKGLCAVFLDPLLPCAAFRRGGWGRYVHSTEYRTQWLHAGFFSSHYGHFILEMNKAHKTKHKTEVKGTPWLYVAYIVGIRTVIFDEVAYYK